MTRAINVSRPVRCAKCSGKFVRRNAREKLCLSCKPRDVRARMAAAAPRAAGVPAALRIEPPRAAADDFTYSVKDRRQSADLALKLARTAAAELPDHAGELVTYARSVARGVVPGSLWQLSHLGYRIAPCTGTRNPCLLPRPYGPETLAEALTGAE
jgi:hypothetical protein